MNTNKLTWKEWLICWFFIIAVVISISSMMYTYHEKHVKLEKIKINQIENAKKIFILEMRQIALDKEWYGIAGKDIEKLEILQRVDKACDEYTRKIKELLEKE